MPLHSAGPKRLVASLALAALGCAPHAGGHDPFRADGLRFFTTARLTEPGDSVLVTVTVRNDAGAQRVVQSGVCGDPLVLRVYREAAARRRPAPAWDSALWRRATEPAGPDRVCLPVAVLQVVKPGDSTAIGRLAIPVRAVLGDSLPAGRYRFTTLADGGDREVGTLELRAPPT